MLLGMLEPERLKTAIRSYPIASSAEDFQSGSTVTEFQSMKRKRQSDAEVENDLVNLRQKNEESPQPAKATRSANQTSPFIKADPDARPNNTDLQPNLYSETEIRPKLEDNLDTQLLADWNSGQEVQAEIKPIEQAEKVYSSSREITIVRCDDTKALKAKEIKFNIDPLRLLDLYLHLKISSPDFISARFITDSGFVKASVRVGSKWSKPIVRKASHQKIAARELSLLKQMQLAVLEALKLLDQNKESIQICIDHKDMRIYTEAGQTSQKSLADIEVPLPSSSIPTILYSSFTLRRTTNEGIKGRVLPSPNSESLLSAFLRSQRDGLRPITRNGCPFIYTVRAKHEGPVKEQVKQEMESKKTTAFEETFCYREMLLRFKICQAALDLLSKEEEAEVQCSDDGIITRK